MAIAEELWPPIAASTLTAVLVGLRIAVEVRRARERAGVAPPDQEPELPL
ncbi:hypothetical protein OVA14_08150 [Agrococcus sp. SL85]|nr:hypothetical protein [Agrococcus sp. SL85]WAC65349.1 hypothetical protein OVA14_08150 [Agrococcus sp. SL85]